MNKQNIIIRVATVNDAEQLAYVRVKTWQNAYKGKMPETFLENLSVEEDAEKWRTRIPEGPAKKRHYYVAEVDGTVVGFVIVGLHRNDDDSKSFSDIGEVMAIYVLMEYQGQGIGNELMKKALESLREDGFKRATLWVLKSNERGRKFYEKCCWHLTDNVKIVDRGEFVLDEVEYEIEL